jgi:hypothetical protein
MRFAVMPLDSGITPVLRESKKTSLTSDVFFISRGTVSVRCAPTIRTPRVGARAPSPFTLVQACLPQTLKQTACLAIGNTLDMFPGIEEDFREIHGRRRVEVYLIHQSILIAMERGLQRMARRHGGTITVERDLDAAVPYLLRNLHDRLYDNAEPLA